MKNKLFFLGVFSDVSGISPDHDKHHGHFVDETNDDWPKNNIAKKHEEGHTAHILEFAKINKREYYNKDCNGIIQYFHD